MSYIGNTTQVANSSYRIVDDISSEFNGVITSFAFKVSGITPVPFPLNPQNCIISVNNVLLKPDVTTTEGFWFSGANIVFKVAPTSGHKFWGVILAGADYVTAGSLNPDGVAVAPSVTFYSSTGTGLFLLSANTLGVSTGGVQRLAINNSGAIGIGGTNFGTNGQIFTSTGSGSAPSWQSPPAGPSITIGDTNATVTDTGSNGAFTVTTEGNARLTINNVGAFGIGGTSFGTSGQILTSSGSGSAPLWQNPAIVSTISVGNTNATVTDTGSDGAFTVTTEGNARLTINSVGAFGIGGTSFGTSGQIFTSNGSGSAPSWQAPPAGASILAGNSSATITDTGTDGNFTVVTEANTRFIINNSGAFGLGGANYGTADQVLISNGSTSPPSWQSLTNTSIAVGNTNATVTDTGSDGAFTVTTEGVSRLTVNSTGLVSLSGNLAVTGTTAFTGIPTGPTAANNTNTTQLATTAFVATATSTLASLASPTFTGTPAAPTATSGTSTTQLATTAFVTAADALLATLVSPTFTGVPNAPTAAGGTDTVQIATTAFVATATSTLASLASPTFTGTPAAPTATSGTSTTQLATTAFVTTAVSNASSITNGNTSATVTDTGSNGAFTVTTEGLSRLIINSTGAFGISGSSFGTSGQVFTSAGSEAAPTWQTPAPNTKIIVGNTYAEVGDTGADGTFNVVTEGNSRLTINSNGAFGLGGANYGTADQVLISNGSTSPPSWQSLTNTSIAVGNTNATVTDTGSDGAFTVTTEGVSRLTVNSTGLVSLSGNLAVTGTTAFTGIPTGPTAGTGTNTTQLATTAFVATAISPKANLASPAFTGVPTAPSAAVGTNTTQIATTAFVDATADLKADIAGPTFTGIPKAPTAGTGTNTTQLATTAFVEATADLKANIASPTFTGTVVLPTETSVTASSQPALVINSTAITSWKSLLAFSKSGIRKWEIGVDPTGAGNNVLYFKDDVASLERARINPTGYLKISPTGTYQDSVSTTHEINGGTTTSGSPLMLRQLSLTTAPWYVGPYNATGNFWIYNSSGIGMYMANGAQVWTGTSDERLKTIIEPISNALNKVSSLRAVIGRFNVDPVGTRRSFLIAQDVQAVLPEAVDVRDDEIGTLGLAYSDVIPLLVAALKESLVRIQELESKVTAFKTA